MIRRLGLIDPPAYEELRWGPVTTTPQPRPGTFVAIDWEDVDHPPGLARALDAIPLTFASCPLALAVGEEAMDINKLWDVLLLTDYRVAAFIRKEEIQSNLSIFASHRRLESVDRSHPEVEPAGVEPASANRSIVASTCVVRRFVVSSSGRPADGHPWTSRQCSRFRCDGVTVKPARFSRRPAPRLGRARRGTGT